MTTATTNQIQSARYLNSSGFHFCTAGCGRMITWRFAICKDCEEEFGRSAKGWPEWLRESWNMTQRWRRLQKKAHQYEVPTDIITTIAEEDSAKSLV